MSTKENLKGKEPINEEGKKEVEELLTAIQGALEDDPECIGSFVNEFGDPTFAIPLGGGQEELNRFMENRGCSNR